MKSALTAASGLALVFAVVAVNSGTDRLEARVPQAPLAPANLDASASPIAPAANKALGLHDIVNNRVPGYGAAGISASDAEVLTAVVKKNCAGCHSDNRKGTAGNLTLQSFTLGNATSTPETAEKMINKLRAGMMPPPGRARPGGDTLDILVSTLEKLMDAKAVSAPNPGGRTFQRLNRAEYTASIQDLLGLNVDAGSWLPLDTKSANFDNIADVQTPSATLLDAYMDAASEISRMAVGDPSAKSTTSTYKLPRLASQIEHVEGTPIGTRGGMSVTHNFPADGEYVFTVLMHASPTGQLYGAGAPFDEKIEIAVNGERVAVIEVDRWMTQADPNGMEIKTKPIPLRAGANRISASFLKSMDGPVNDNIAPVGHSIADTQIGMQSGITIFSHLQSFAVTGPFNPTGVSETEARKRIFSCRPTTPTEARPCAEKILSRIATEAYRRPVAPADLKAVMNFYDAGAKQSGFETGIRTGIEAVLSSPNFIFRVEQTRGAAKPGEKFAVSSMDLASRLSYFIWGSTPDSTLIAMARRGALADTTALVAQTKRMLADPRSEALATRFASQWLRLQDVDKVAPDALQYPNYDLQLADDMKRETEMFFANLVKENRSVTELFSADYSFMNESLAKHYGINGVSGTQFRMVKYPDNKRAGLLGHGSVLTLTSHANRTSPVLRGKWVMEVLLGAPPPPPPPDVPDLEKTGEAKEGRFLTTRERMEIHRAATTCNSCHQFMDPIGLALDNFDVIGQWRIRENGEALDTKGTFYDGSTVSSPSELTKLLLKRPAPMLRTFTANMMAYAIGRRVEYYDAPTIRRIVSNAEKNNYRMQDIVLGVVKSDAFRMKREPVAQAVQAEAAPSSAPPSR
jgi:mono/diheme cytochrome c family protein